SPKAFNISKLRAEITWNHQKESNSIEFLAPNFQESIQNQQEVTNEENNEPFNETDPETESRLETKSRLKTESRLEPEPKNEDNMANENINNKEIADSNSLEEEFNEEKEEFSLLVDDIIHPAVDSSAKWDQITLFNELPLL
ncbi:15097_t:CDS:2, partial [Dentiscutata erythropus]